MPYLTDVSLKEQLLDVVDELEGIVKQVLDALYLDKKLTDKDLQTKVPLLLEQYNERQAEFVELLKKVPEHQEREKYIRALEEITDAKDSLIERMATELKSIEGALTEATFQAEKKLKSVKLSETNRVFSEEVIRYAHLISKHHSVSSPGSWQLGDPSRPYPTEANFAVSNLLLSRTQPAGQMPMMRGANPAMFNLPGLPTGQKPFTPGTSRLNMFPPGLGPPSAGGTSSPRGRPPGSGAGRMSSASPRSMPKILARSSSQQNAAARFQLIMPGQQQQQMASPSSSSGFLSPSQQQMLLNLPPNMQMMPQGTSAQMPSAAAMDVPVPTVEQMSSESGSSSSSSDEASPEGR